jgi:dethiobiotin synthetase
LAPLGEGFTAADLIKKLRCRVLIASANRLGALNHTLLTVRSMQAIGVKRFRIVLSDAESVPHASRITHRMPIASRTNPQILAELLHPNPVFRLPHFPELSKSLGKIGRIAAFQTICKNVKKTLAQILG